MRSFGALGHPRQGHDERVGLTDCEKQAKICRFTLGAVTCIGRGAHDAREVKSHD